MTAKELVEELQKLPQSMPVIIYVPSTGDEFDIDVVREGEN